MEKNVDAIRIALSPQNDGELRSFLGMVTFYNKFMPDLSTILAPLYKLLEKGAKWTWSTKAKKGFVQVKNALCAAPVLTKFDPNRKPFLECHASSYGVGAALFHHTEGEKRPVGFRSRTLTTAERKYSQIEREALAFIFGVTRFRDYLLGREFTLVTDHQPLLGLLRHDRQTPVMAAARIQRWVLLLGAYKCKLQYKPGKFMLNADTLSRLPQSLEQELQDAEDTAEYVLVVDQWDEPAVPMEELPALTQSDGVLSSVCKYFIQGWPQRTAEEGTEMREYHKRRNELSVQYNLPHWGHRVVVPAEARKKLLKLLHGAPQGVSAMKAVAWSKFWWPGLDDDIERLAAVCQHCVQALPMPPAQAPIRSPETQERWLRLHVDFAGHIQNKMLLVVVDSHSKWIEAIPLAHATARNTVDALRTLFSRFGLPHTIVSDNGTLFTGWEFNEFLQQNGVVHVRPPPYHPQSNELAERAVQTIKDGLKKCGDADLTKTLAGTLCRYRNTTLPSGRSPSEMLLGYRLRTQLHMCFPPRSRATGDVHSADSAGWNFAPGDPVYLRNYGRGDKWTPGKVRSISGARIVSVDTENGLVHRHMDQLRRKIIEEPSSPEALASPQISPDSPVQDREAPTATAPGLPGRPPPELRRSTRIKKPVERYGF